MKAIKHFLTLMPVQLKYYDFSLNKLQPEIFDIYVCAKFVVSWCATHFLLIVFIFFFADLILSI
jgi:hypothetical protein